MLLTTENLRKDFGGLAAVDGVNLEVEAGEFRSIIGPNGAGKTTLFNLLTGVLPPTDGTIVFDGEDITDMPPHERVTAGISRSFQVTNVFPELSIRKNIRIAVQNRLGYGRNFWSDVDDLEDLEAETVRIAERVDLGSDLDATADTMSHGEKRRLELGISIAQDPELLLLDEPAAGMSQEETSELVEIIRGLNEECTILLIEHDIDLVVDLSERITVLKNGAVLAEGTPEEVTQDEQVQEAYIGGDL